MDDAEIHHVPYWLQLPRLVGGPQRCLAGQGYQSSPSATADDRVSGTSRWWHAYTVPPWPEVDAFFAYYCNVNAQLDTTCLTYVVHVH